MKLLGIAGTLIGAKTRTLVDGIVERAALLDPALQTGVLDLRNCPLELCDGRPPADYSASTRRAIEEVVAADCYVIGTPIFQASLTGALKNLFDLLPATALRGKVVGFVGTGGTYQHFLVIENQLKPIAGYFRAYVAPDYVYAHRDHFDDRGEVAAPDVLERMDALAAQIVRMSGALSGSGQGA